jgi:uncharacterized membrane protein YheB (UPF0754 family)
MEEKKVNSSRNSTVAVSPEIGKKLERFCSSCGITKKDFISLALDYFQRYGINPAKHESPAKEMEKLIKKNDQVIAFIRKQEQDILRPMLEAITTSEVRINKNLDDIVNKDNLNQFIQAIKENTDIQQDSRRKLIEAVQKAYSQNEKQNQEVKHAIEVLAQFLDDKNKSGLIGKLFG